MNIRKIAGDFLEARRIIQENEKMLKSMPEDVDLLRGLCWDNILHCEDEIRQMCHRLGIDGEIDPVNTMHEFLKQVRPFESTGANRGPLLYTNITVRRVNPN
tara:strand:+ start:489 stop:794 length:306 start_codon:yes stop_codon:yes gene_type:complete